MNLTEVSKKTVGRVLVYGEPKSGKTQLASELAQQYKLLYFDLEGGYDTLMKLPQEQQKNIELIRIPDTTTFPVAAETMSKVVTGAKTQICELHGKVNCQLCLKNKAAFVTVQFNTLPKDTIVVIDSLTQLASSIMAHITKNKPSGYKVEWEDYTRQGMLMEEILTEFQQARYNLVVITHVVETHTDSKKIKLVPIAGTKNFSRNTSKYFDHVVYCEVLNKEHKFGSSTIYSIKAVTGSRRDIEIETMKKPSLLPFFRDLPPSPSTLKIKE